MNTLYAQQTTLPSKYINSKVLEFLKEDYADQDITTQNLLLEINKTVTSNIVAEQKLIFVGEKIIKNIFKNCQIQHLIQDGQQCQSGDKIATIIGDPRLLLSRERVLLNLIQRLSGIATLTDKYVQTLKTPNIKILDTRKTTPGLRLFEKYAVTIGGGYNHRMHLYDGAMFKDNHLTILNNFSKTIKTLKNNHPNKHIQIEVDQIQQLRNILQSIPNTQDIHAILLDNMTLNEIRQCSKIIRMKLPHCFIESSGGITLTKILDYQHIDIDGISIGALTHQATSKNIKFEFDYGK